MAAASAGFHVPQLQEGLDEREALDCFILDYVGYDTVIGWLEEKAECKYDDQSQDGKKNSGRNRAIVCRHFEQLCPQR